MGLFLRTQCSVYVITQGDYRGSGNLGGRVKECFTGLLNLREQWETRCLLKIIVFSLKKNTIIKVIASYILHVENQGQHRLKAVSGEIIFFMKLLILHSILPVANCASIEYKGLDFLNNLPTIIIHSQIMSVSSSQLLHTSSLALSHTVAGLRQTSYLTSLWCCLVYIDHCHQHQLMTTEDFWSSKNRL